jgi:hypothetical protein
MVQMNGVVRGRAPHRDDGGAEKGSESESCHAQGLIGLLADRY